MSKSTSLNSLEHMDPNVTNEIDNVLAEIESSKHNNPPPTQQIQMPPMQGQQLPPQQPVQEQRQMYEQPLQQLPQMPTPMMPNYYQNPMVAPSQTQSGLLDFLQSFMIMGDEFKWVGIIAGLFVLMNLPQTINLISNYLSFTVNELGNVTMLGDVARGLVLGVLFVLSNKFI